ncbi:MAG: caspase family protein [Dinghuibacter sp.]|nr:caspase family protein [Dinghuibacter sp.]
MHFSKKHYPTGRLYSALCLLLTTCLAFAGNAQQVYHFTYPANKPGAEKEEAFFVRYNDGTGFARVLSGITITELTLQEEFPLTTSGEPNPDMLYYKVTGARKIPGGSTSTETPVFWFRKNNSAEQPYIPWGVKHNTLPDSSGLTHFSLPPRVLPYASLKNEKELVLRFFTTEDALYKNLFVIKPKGLNADEAKTRIHLLVVANTNDNIIGPSCKKDMDRMVNLFKDLALAIGIAPPVVTTISGADYSKANADKQINALKPDPRDIVVFYYSGHGFRKERDNRKFPYIDLRANPQQDYNVFSLNMEDIYNRIKAKPGRLKLVLSDCCNTLVTATNAIGNPIPNPKGFGLLLSELNYRALLFKPGNYAYLFTAASPGEKATSNNEFGGFFSHFFKVAFENHCGYFRNNVSWNMLFDEVQRNTIYKAEHTYCAKPYIPENICEQSPIMKQ